MGKFSRIFCAVLSVILVVCALPTLPLVTFASDDYTRTERYMTDKFSSDGCRVSMGAEYAAIEIFESDSSISAEVNISEDIRELNAIKINLQNNSSCDRIIFEYTFVDTTGIKQTRKANVDIETNTKRQDYFLYLDLSNGLVNYKLTFDSAHSGRIRIYSVNALSLCQDISITQLGTVSECIFDPASSSVNVRGTVKYDISVKYKDGKLGLFALGASDTLERVALDFERRAIYEVDMSNRFSFNVSVSGFADRFSRYAVFMIYTDESGNTLRSPLDYARYAECADSYVSPIYKQNSFNGVNSMYFSSAIDANAASAVVDVYLNSLINTANANIPYSIYGYNVYFDRSYLEYIDLAVKNYSAIGTKVYLRFLISQGEDELVYSTCDTKAKYRGILLDTEEAAMCVYAVADFLGSRYSSSNSGTVDGIILGTRVDLASTHNYVGTMTLERYAQNFARVICIFSSAWRAYNPSLELVVPLSATACDDVILPKENFDAYSQHIFMSGVCNYILTSLSQYNQIRLMFESDSTPCRMGSDGLLSPDQSNNNEIGVSDVKSFENMIKSIRFQECLDDDYIYYWNVGAVEGVELAGSYVYSYLTLFNERRVSEFIVSFSETEINGGSDKFFQIKNIYKYIDSQRSDEVTDPVRVHFGIDSWNDIIAKYVTKNEIRLKVIENELFSEPIANIKGDFSFWDFSLATGSLGWYGGVNCTALGVSSLVGSRALVGNMSVAHGDEYGDMVYEFAYTEDLCIGDYLSFDVLINDELSASYELKLTLGGENYVVESKYLLAGNSEFTRLYFDTSTLEDFGNVKYLKLSARSLSGSINEFSLSLAEMNLHSASKNSEELEEAVLNSRSELRQAMNEVQKRNALSTKYVIAISIAILFMTVVTIMVARKKTFFN